MLQSKCRFRLFCSIVIATIISASVQPGSILTHNSNTVSVVIASDPASKPTSRVISSCLSRRCDGARSIYGISGSFDADSTEHAIERCINSPRSCRYVNVSKYSICDDVVCPNGKLTLFAVQRLGASLVRFGVKLACPPFTKGSYYWHLDEANPDGNFPDIATVVHQALFVDHLIPVIDFLYPNQCGHAPLQPADAAAEMQDFVHDTLDRSSRNMAVYFELGNEVNDKALAYYTRSPGVPAKCLPNQSHNCKAVFQGSRFNAAYAQAFAKEAQALQAAMSSQSQHKYWILTGSILNPEANTDRYACGLQTKGPVAEANFDNYSIAQDALNAAIKAGVAPGHLGIAIHPYHYNTSDTFRWHDYYGPIEVAHHQGQVIAGHSANKVKHLDVVNHYADKCSDLGTMMDLWTQPIRYGHHQYQLPLVFTEDNWTTNGSAGAGAANTPTEVQSYLDGAYLVDFMSWMNIWARNHRDKPVRVLWYRGSDSGEGGYNLGLYYPGGGEKGIDHFHWCNNSDIKHLDGTHRNTVSADFRLLARGGSC